MVISYVIKDMVDNLKNRSLLTSSLKRMMFLLFYLIPFFVYSANPPVNFYLDAPKSVVAGEKFQISFISNRKGSDFRMNGAPKGINIIFGPSTSTSQSISIVNGKQSSSFTETYTYVCVAENKGHYEIPSSSIVIDGNTYKTASRTIEVLPPDNTSQNRRGVGATSASQAHVGSKDVMIRVVVSQKNPYVQEGVLVTFRLYTLFGIRNIGKIEFPQFNGFICKDIELPRSSSLQRENYNGHNYWATDIKKTLLFPLSSGDIKIPSGTFNFVLEVPSGRYVETFFGREEEISEVSKTIKSNPLIINVKPLPSGKPADFSGAVGNFTIEEKLSSTETHANESCALDLIIKGDGNFSLLKSPEVKFPSSFDTYGPQIVDNTNLTATGFSGTKEFKYTFVPNKEGKFTIPEIQWSYFDPSSKSYKKIVLPQKTIDVGKALHPQSKRGGLSSSALNKLEAEKDIRFLKTGSIKFIHVDNIFVGSLLYYIIYVFLLCLTIIAFLLIRNRRKNMSDVVLLRSRKANKVAIKRLKRAKVYMDRKQEEQFYEEMLTAVWGYFSDKFSIPVSELSRQGIESELVKRGTDETLVREFIDIIDKCEFARYAPVALRIPMEQIYRQGVSAIGEMEKQIKSKQ